MNQSIRDPEMERAAALLSRDPDYRILKRLMPADLPAKSLPDMTIGVVVDVETTGLDHDVDEVIELAMIKFAFARDGEIGAPLEQFRGLREPSIPIPEEISELTGITPAAVQGRQIDTVAVSEFVDGVSLVVAHNAAFDRPFCERLWPVFRDISWGDSATQIDWLREGIGGARLEYILSAFGRFYAAHQALDDCAALLFALCQRLPKSQNGAFGELLRNARKPQARIYAVGAGYDLRFLLKRRGYRWNDGLDGCPRAWWRDVDLDELDAEKAFLADLPTKPAVHPVLFKLTARNRFRRGLLD